ncbi:MAG: hypothetical protein HOU01_23685 [Streptomycetaceae bacterium]|nr:hypothetical protein [Streptomycetaceae bacterium]
MYPATQTIWLEATDRVSLGLRRYRSGADGFDCEHGYHSALVITGEASARRDDDGYPQAPEKVDHDDPRWPTHCEKGCGYAFAQADHWQEWSEALYARSDTEELTSLRDAPPGSMWDANWLPADFKGPDGVGLMVRCPNGHDWAVDREASNCTRKGEPHACWVRHGDPRECRLTVDKNGDTCAAGAGSILAGDYHGFLQNGVLTAG